MLEEELKKTKIQLKRIPEINLIDLDKQNLLKDLPNQSLNSTLNYKVYPSGSNALSKNQFDDYDKEQAESNLI